MRGLATPVKYKIDAKENIFDRQRDSFHDLGGLKPFSKCFIQADLRLANLMPWGAVQCPQGYCHWKMKRMAKRMPRHLPVAQGVVLELLLFDTSIINRLMTQQKGTVWGHETLCWTMMRFSCQLEFRNGVNASRIFVSSQVPEFKSFVSKIHHQPPNLARSS